MLSGKGRVFIFCAADQFGHWKEALYKYGKVIVETALFLIMYNQAKKQRPPPNACSTSAGMMAILAHRSTMLSTFNYTGSRGRMAIYSDYVVPPVGELVSCCT